MKIAVFLPNWVGDACMATPALRALRQRYREDAEILLIGRRAPIEILQGNPFVDRCIEYRPRGRPKQMGRRDVAWALRREGVDVALLLTNSLSTAMMAYLGGVNRRIGYAKDGRSWFLTDRFHLPKQAGKKIPIPAIDAYLRLVEILGCDISDRHTELDVSDCERAAAKEVWEDFGWEETIPTVAINSSGAYGSSKVWPRDKVVSLARNLAETGRYQVLLHCGPGERDEANGTAQECGTPRVRSLGEGRAGVRQELPLGLSKAVLGKAGVVVTTDSGPRHIALALNRPVITLFGSTSPEWTRSYNVPEKEFYLGLACQPCYRRTCPLQHQACMRDLSVPTILKAIEERIGSASEPFPSSGSPRLSDVA